MALGEAGVRAPRGGLPARAALRPARVEAQPRDDHERVSAVREDRYPLAGPPLAVVLELGRDERRVQKPRAGQRERDRAGAVVALVAPGAVAAAPFVRLGGDLVAGGDDRGHDV